MSGMVVPAGWNAAFVECGGVGAAVGAAGDGEALVGVGAGIVAARGCHGAKVFVCGCAVRGAHGLDGLFGEFAFFMEGEAGGVSGENGAEGGEREGAFDGGNVGEK